MKNSKLLQLLTGLTPKEMSRFSKFVQSPFYNTNPSHIRFYDFLKTVHPRFKASRVEKEMAFEAIYPGKPFNYSLLGKLVSEMTRLVEKYLTILQLEKKEGVQKKLLLGIYAERPVYQTQFKKQVDNVHQFLEQTPFKDAHYFKGKFKLEEKYFNHISTDKFKLKPEQYEQSMMHLDQWYILEKLLLSCEMKAREKPLAEKYDIKLLADIKNNLIDLSINNPVIDTYLAMLDLLENGDEEIYFELKKVFNKNIDRFGKTQQQNILQVLINYAIQKGNKGDELFLKENFELNIIGLKYDLFLFNEILSDLKYISIIIVANKNNKYNWCFDFLEKYENYLEKSIRADANALGRGLWLFDQNKPDKTIELINSIEFKNDFYKNQTRVLLIKSYFEKFIRNESYYGMLIYQTNSFEKTLKRNKNISKTRKKSILNFLWCIKQVSTMFFHHQRDQSKKIEIKIKNMGLVTSRLWLLEKLQ